MIKRRIKNIGFLLFFFGMFLSSAFISAQKKFDINRKFAPSALIDDSKVIRKVMLEMHPVMGIYKPKEYYASLFDQFISSLNDSLTEKQFRIRLKLLFDELHCGHTEVVQSKAYTRAIKPMQLNFLPYYVITVNNKVFVGIAMPGKKDSLIKPGSEILKINNVMTDSILNYCKRFVTADGYIHSGKNLAMRGGLNYYYPSLFGRPDSFFVKYRHRTDTHEVWLKASRLKDLPVVPIRPKEDSTWKKYKRANMSVGYLDPGKNAFVLKIRSFKATGYNKVYKKTFKRLKKDKINNLVIDLRSNGGGNLMNSYKLLSYLIDSTETITLETHVKAYPLKQYTKGNIAFKFTRFVLGIDGKKRLSGDTGFYTHKIKPSKKYHYNGKLYVLINGGTFSASCIVSAYLRETSKAKFIGSETSGAKEGCNAGVTPFYKLPNTKLLVRVPAFRIVHDVDPAITGRGILPDYEITYELLNILKREDLELKKVKELLQL